MAPKEGGCKGEKGPHDEEYPWEYLEEVRVLNSETLWLLLIMPWDRTFWACAWPRRRGGPKNLRSRAFCVKD